MDFETHLKKYLNKNEIGSLLKSIKEDDMKAVILNPKKINSTQFINLFPNCIPHPIVKNCFIYNPKEYELGKSLYHELGCFYIQEPSSAVNSFLLEPNKDDLILDLCAAPGGKSIQCSFLMEDDGLILANDISKNRALKIKENVERLGISNTIVCSNDFSKIYKKYLNFFDKIILDAPCSGSGMFKKSLNMQEDWTYNKVIKYSNIQKELIIMAYNMLKPGGILSYSTCSFSFEEDEEVVMHLLSKTDAIIYPIENNPLFYKSFNNIGIHLLPHIFPGDGQYICFIKKPGIIKKTNFIKNNKNNYDFSNKLNEFKYGNTIFGIKKFINLKDLSIIRTGVKIGEIDKNIFEYDIHYAHYLSNFKLEESLSLEECLSYIKGDCINKTNEKGYYLLKFDNIPICFSKSDGKVFKNHYPKYLRKKH